MKSKELEVFDMECFRMVLEVNITDRIRNWDKREYCGNRVSQKVKTGVVRVHGED